MKRTHKYVASIITNGSVPIGKSFLTATGGKFDNIEPGIRKADLKAELLTLYEDYAAALDRNEMDRWMGFFTE
ncbi:MAG: hypothetical protein AB7S46_11525, partial [Flavobacteriaceae bacterium]